MQNKKVNNLIKIALLLLITGLYGNTTPGTGR